MHVYIFFKVQGEEILPCSVNFLFISQCYIMKKLKAMASHSSTVAQKIPWMEEPGRLQSMGSLRVRHD